MLQIMKSSNLDNKSDHKSGEDEPHKKSDIGMIESAYNSALEDLRIDADSFNSKAQQRIKILAKKLHAK